MANTKQSIPVDQRGHAIHRAMGLPLLERNLYLGSATYWTPVFNLNQDKYITRAFTGLAVRNPSASSGILLAAVGIDQNGVPELGSEYSFLEVGVQQYFTLDRLMFGPGVVDESEEFFTRYILAKLTVAQGTNASGTIGYAATQPSDGDSFDINGVNYEFSDDGSGTGSQDHIVDIGASADITYTNLVNKINAVQYEVRASINTGTDTVTLTATAGGTTGNSIALVDNGTGATLSGATLAGGTGGVLPSFHIW